MFKKFVWNPTQPTATRPLAIQKDGNWFTYGYDITKNVCEVFGLAGYIRTVIAGGWEDSGAGCCPGKENK